MSGALASRPPKTLTDVLRRRAELEPEVSAYAWLGADGAISEEYTYSALERRARSIAVELSGHARPGDRCLLLHPPGLEFVAAYFGCLFAGMIAVPAHPPSKPRDRRRVSGIARSAAPAVVLGERDLLADFELLSVAVPELSRVQPIVTRDIPLALAEDFRAPAIRPDDVAFLQYTSGSTGDPKGVMVTHENLVANELTIQRAFRSDRDSTVVGWLPHFHDMGLVGNILQPLWLGCRSLLFSPASFIRDPLRWVRAISRFRARVSGGPNFAYELCARRAGRLSEREPIDLSCWDTAFVGAEPVRAATLGEFARAFEPFGFRRTSLFPCYGLAEATLYVAGVEQGRGMNLVSPPRPRGSSIVRRLVSSGFVGDGQVVRIVDPADAAPCEPGVEGEIWVSGANVAKGYWRREHDSAERFAAHLPDEPDRSFLRTGDLGVLVNGELVVTGRLKDLIIVRGQNFYPEDIEPVVERAHPALRACASAAFSFTVDGEERVAVVAEVSRGKIDDSPEALAERVRLAVADELELRLDVVVLISPQTLPKTSSGKIARQAARAAYLAGQLEVVGQSALGLTAS